MLRLLPCLVFLMAGPAAAHRNYTRPDLHVTCKVGTKALICGLSLPERVLAQILGGPTGLEVVPDAARQRALRAELTEVFQRHNPVEVDGQRVAPEVRETVILLDQPHNDLITNENQVEGIRMHQSGFNVVQVVLGYPLAGPPRQIRFTWDLASAYTTTSPDERPEQRLPVIPVSLLYNGEWLTFEHTPQEPQFIWHTPDAPALPDPPPPPRPVAAQIDVPWVASGLAALGLILALALRRRRRAAIAVLLATSAAVPATWGLARLAVTLPWTRVAPPTAEEARQIFTALHTQVYRAFDFAQEDAIYDSLARSVDGPLLDWLYTEVYRSLVLQDQGGAVAQVQAVDVLETELLDPPDPAASAFRLRARWRVTGTVEHFGHAHQRTNTYTARYTIDRRAGPGQGENTWKIVAMEPEDQQRAVADPAPSP